MQTSSARLQHEDMLEQSRNTIRPGGWQCEWNIADFNKPTMCKTVLASWNAYLKHILNHCREYQRKNKGHSYGCRLPRCSLPSGVPMSSYKELVSHLTASHLNRSSLNCPVIGCHSTSFRAPIALRTHCEEVHPELLRGTASTSTDLFSPSWLPFRPAPSGLPPIPTGVIPGSVLVGLVEGTWRARPSTPRRLSSGKGKFASPKKPSKMDAPTNVIKPKQDGDDTQEHEEIIFDDLPEQLNDSKSYFRNPEYECVIREKGPYFDVSRPQPLLDATIFGYRVLPDTILYNAWVRQNQDILDAYDEEEEDEEEDEEEEHKKDEQKEVKIGPSASSSSSV